MAEKTNKKAGRGAGYYQAQRHRTAANKARRAARRARLTKKGHAAGLRRVMASGIRWATKYVANLTRRIRQLDPKWVDQAEAITRHENRIAELRQQFSLP